jgi:hypothetical protein
MNVTALTGGGAGIGAAAVSTTSSSSDFGALLDKARKKAGTSAADDIAAYVKMTPAQRMRADILKKMGLTEDDVKAMPADKRQALEDKIASMMKVQMENAGKNGQIAVG